MRRPISHFNINFDLITFIAPLNIYNAVNFVLILDSTEL
jgi:hypothetical protein